MRERAEDIPPLVERIRMDGTLSLQAGAIDEMKRYHWLGNVRELRNVAERLMLLSEDGHVDGRSVEMALPAAAGRAEAAKAMGLERLYKKCQQLGVDLQTLKTDVGA